jgi:hypothetical protein
MASIALEALKLQNLSLRLAEFCKTKEEPVKSEQ